MMKSLIDTINWIRDYLRVQSKIYDLSRWAFLFGRRQVMTFLPLEKQETLRILEVVCGTGQNTRQLVKRFPNARIWALDLSWDMLQIAKKKLNAHKARVFFDQRPYTKGYGLPNIYDLILFSYSLSMIKPGYEQLILQAKVNLKPGGLIAVVDFHDARWQPYKEFMDSQYITMEAHLLPILQQHFRPLVTKVRLSPILTIWRYMIFIGQKANQNEATDIARDRRY